MATENKNLEHKIDRLLFYFEDDPSTSHKGIPTVLNEAVTRIGELERKERDREIEKKVEKKYNAMIAAGVSTAIGILLKVADWVY